LPTSPEGSGGPNYDAEFLEPVSRAHATFKDLREAIDICIAILYLGQNLTTEMTKGGSYAAEKGHDIVRLDYTRGDAEYMATGLREGLIMPWGRFNRASWNDDDAPWPYWDVSEQEDQAKLSEAWWNLASTFETMQRTGVPVDYVEASHRAGLPLVDGATNEAIKPPEPPAPDNGGGNAGGGAGGGGRQGPSGGRGGPRRQRGSGGRADDLRAKGPATTQEFLDSQLFADRVIGHLHREVRAELVPFLDKLEAAIEGAKSYEDVRAAVLEVYENADDPDTIEELVEAALTMAHRGGQYAVELEQ
jgi:phage gp29-like protein